jgi:hypothetical protein
MRTSNAGCTKRTVSDPRAAEILLRWMQRPKPAAETPGVDLDSMSVRELERLTQGSRAWRLSDKELHALVASLLAEKSDC